MNRTPLVLAGILVVAVVVLTSCRSSEKAQSEDMASGQEKEMPMPAEPGPGVPPGHCRLVATVLSIDSTLSNTGDDPCSKSPCVATVRIDEVVGYGSGFTTVLGKGSEITIRFRYTLGPSKDLFPLISPSLPGLESGSRFQADLRMSDGSMGSGKTGYVVERYAVRQ